MIHAHHFVAVGEDVEALVNPFVTISAGTFASTLLGTDLIDDSIVEETEMFFVEIVNVSIGAVGPQSRATIIIFDNDGEWGHIFHVSIPYHIVIQCFICVLQCFFLTGVLQCDCFTSVLQCDHFTSVLL